MTATDYNAQFRDNLLWLRQDAQLTGTAALLDLGCGTLGTNEVLFSDCTWATIPTPPTTFAASAIVSGTFPTARLANDAVTQAKIADAAVGNAQLKTGTDSAELIGVGSGNHSMQFTINDFSFFAFPINNTDAGTESVSGIGVSTAVYNAQATPNLTGQINVNGSTNGKFIWKFIAASDHPGIWVVLSADGTIQGIYESEDYESTESPLSLIQTTDDNGVTTTPSGQRQLNIGLPTLAVIESLYANLTASVRTAALSCTGDYVTGRGWLDAFSTLSDLSGIESRYEPSGRQWAMRCAAQASDVAVTGFYLDALVVSSGAWAVP